MIERISFDLVSPERLVLSDDAELITFPASEGDMGVMAGHVPLVTALRPGVIAIKGGSKGDPRFYVTGGFAEIAAGRLTLLAEEALPIAELDASALDQRIKDAEEDVGLAKSDSDRIKAQELLDYLKGQRAAL